jgi:deoxyribonuclease V
MQATLVHRWDVTPREAIELQRALAPSVVRRGALREADVQLIAGADVAFDRRHGRAVAAAVVLAYPSLECIEQAVVEAPAAFPYIPGLLSFRETPPLIDAFERLRARPNLLMADGHGCAHPRLFGYACHLGLVLDLPSIGVAKTRLIGSHAPVPPMRGARADLLDGNAVIGAVLRTRERARPVFVSVGHRAGLAAAERWVLRCARGYRMPEPTRLADALSRSARTRMVDATLDIVIEQRAGEQGRWEWHAGDQEVHFQHELDPMPTHYGCAVDLLNPADGELLDVMIVDGRERGRGEHMAVRVLDVLERSDGDDKLLAVPVDVDPSHPATRRRIAAARRASWAWYAAHGKPIVRWGGEDAAASLIRSCS